MTRTLFAIFAFVLAGCSGQLVTLRMDVPVGARVVIPRGYGTPEVDFATPFVGQFESGSMTLAGGYPMVFKLDAAAAKGYGGDHAVDIFARLNVNNPTDFSKTQTIRIAVSDERLRALLRGEVSEISAYVEDPNEAKHPKLAIITMRLARF